MKRPVWLLSMNTEQFCAPPLTTGGLKAYFVHHGSSAAVTDVTLLHFLNAEEVEAWLAKDWPEHVLPHAESAVAAGLAPVLALSCYTWNVAEFLEVAKIAKHAVPGITVVAGGPHVQRAEDFLKDESIDAVVLGEGEQTFTELLDTPTRAAWKDIAGCAFVGADGRVVKGAARPRRENLDELPSALTLVPLRDEEGRALYRQVAYETSRGCPYRCSFCEWGTGAIGTKMHQYSLERIRTDLDTLVAGGVQDIWLCDSNFGALREDVAKAEMIVDLRNRTGLPQTFATSWSKNHNQRVQGIVRLLHQNGLLWHYHLALQTLTPKALELAHRTNMRANDYEPVVKALAAEGVPVVAELIWGLPGDTLAEFEKNLDHLFTVFPNINIFAYTLLPGTEFYDLRDEYRIEALPVAGYGKAKGEYVVGCHTFSRAEGEEGYFLVAAHVMFSRGHVIPYTIRDLAFDGRVSVSKVLRSVLHNLIEEFAGEVDDEPLRNRMAGYERRAELYLHFLGQRERMFASIRATVRERILEAGADDLLERALQVLRLDEALCPRTGEPVTIHPAFDFAAAQVMESLARMDLPEPALFEASAAEELEIYHTARVGEVLKDPDGGAWMCGRVKSVSSGVKLVRDTRTELVERVAGAKNLAPLHV